MGGHPSVQGGTQVSGLTHPGPPSGLWWTTGPCSSPTAGAVTTSTCSEVPRHPVSPCHTCHPVSPHITRVTPQIPSTPPHPSCHPLSPSHPPTATPWVPWVPLCPFCVPGVTPRVPSCLWGGMTHTRPGWGSQVPMCPPPDYVCVLDVDFLELLVTTWKGNGEGQSPVSWGAVGLRGCWGAAGGQRGSVGLRGGSHGADGVCGAESGGP